MSRSRSSRKRSSADPPARAASDAATPPVEPLEMTLFNAPTNGHLTLARHWTAEKPREEYHPRLGTLTRWGVADGKTRVPHNHFLDAAVLACAAAAACGVSPLDADGSRLATRKTPITTWAIHRKRPSDDAWQARPWNG